jgi:hypothetical protein
MTTRSVWLGCGVIGFALVLVAALSQRVPLSYPSSLSPEKGIPSQDRIFASGPFRIDVRGRLSDPRGRPLVQTRVQLLMEQFANGRRELMPLEMLAIGTQNGGCSETDSDGLFRCWNIPSGRYYLAASPSLAILGTGDAVDYYETLLYPSTTEIDAAETVVVSPDAPVGPIDFVFRLPALSNISGVVLDINGRPATQGFVLAMPRGEGLQAMSMGTGFHGGRIERDGTFRIRNLMAREYSLRANVPRPAPAPGTFLPLKGSPSAVVRVAGADLDGIALREPPVVTLRGHVSFAPGVRPPPASMLRVTTRAFEADDGWLGIGGTSGGPLPSLDANYDFAIQTIPGRIIIIVSDGSADIMEWRVKRIVVGGIARADAKFVLDSESPPRVEIEMMPAPREP